MASHTSAVMCLTSLPLADVQSIFPDVVLIVSVAVYRLWLGYILCGLHFLKNLDALAQFLSLHIAVILLLMKECIVASLDLLMALLADLRLALHSLYVVSRLISNSSGSVWSSSRWVTLYVLLLLSL